MKRLFIVVFALCVSLMMSQTLIAEDDARGGAASGMLLKKNFSAKEVEAEALEAIEIKVHWVHCQQSWRKIGDTKTWCKLKDEDAWIWTTDDFAAQQMIAAAASGHWFGFNVINSDGTWDHCILWEY
jgi:hypothetical protein